MVGEPRTLRIFRKLCYNNVSTIERGEDHVPSGRM